MFFGVYQPVRNLKPCIEFSVEFDSVVYNEYLNRKSILEACTDESQKPLLEAQVNVLLEVTIEDIKDKIKKLIEWVKEKLAAISKFVKEKIIDAILNKIKQLKEKIKSKSSKEDNKNTENSSDNKKEDISSDQSSNNEEDVVNSKKKIEKLDFDIYYLNLGKFFKQHMDSLADFVGEFTLRDNQITPKWIHDRCLPLLVISNEVTKDIYGNLNAFTIDRSFGHLQEIMSKSELIQTMQRVNIESFDKEDELKQKPYFKYLASQHISFDINTDPTRNILYNELDRIERQLKGDSKYLDNLQLSIQTNLKNMENHRISLPPDRLEKDRLTGIPMYTAVKDIMSTNISILEVAIRFINASNSYQIGILSNFI